MKILHVAHAHMKSLGARNYFFPVRINNGFIRNGHEVYWFSDRDMARYYGLFNSRKLGARSANRKFLEVCRNFQPDVVALSSADIIQSETLHEARRTLPNCAFFQYYIDPLFHPRNLKNVRSKADVLDWNFVTTGGHALSRVSGRHSRSAFVPNPVDPSIDTHRCHEHTDQRHDIFFAGHLDDRMDEVDDLRFQAPELIKTYLPNARCNFHGLQGQPSLFGAEFMKTLGDTRIGLNFSRRFPSAAPGLEGSLYLYSSDRIGLYLGNGLLAFSGKPFDLSVLYGEGIVEVDGPDDFIDKLRFYLENDTERQRVARVGYELAHSEFNERLVAQYMLERTLGEPMSHDYRWPTEDFGAL